MIFSKFPTISWVFPTFSHIFPTFPSVFPGFSRFSLPSPGVPRWFPGGSPVCRQALNALAEGTAALRRLAQFLALDEAPAARPPMSEDKELPLLLAPGAVVKKTGTLW